MSTQLSDIWQRTMDLLKNELTEISFNTWIKTIEPLSLGSNSINLGVPAEFNKGILESRYTSLIRNAIKQITSKEYNVNIVVPSMDDNKYSNHGENSAQND